MSTKNSATKTQKKKPPKVDFAVGVSTDPQSGEVLAVYFQIRKGFAEDVVELADGAAFADYDKQGYLLGVELLEPCSVSMLDRIAAKEPAPLRSHVRRFLRNAVPRQMLAAAG